MVNAKTCGKGVCILDIIKSATKEYGLSFEEVKKIIKQQEYPAELRDEIAIAIMPVVFSEAVENPLSLAEASKACYTIADAMLEARKVKNEN